MELQNPHPVSATLTVSEMPGYGRRVAMAVAKATFDVAGGKAELETQAPLELLPKDTPTPLGELPRDDLPRCDPVFEVILLGQAHAPGGAPCTRMDVSLAVGTARREFLVSGDRRWEKKGRRPRPTDPEPFTVMPLTWDRAFGGTCAVELDRESFVDLSDVRNPAGRGWDPAPDAEALAKRMKSPKGYPKFDPTRLLPNVERPESPVAAWEDAPDPACWAPVPTASSIHALRMVQDGPDGPQIGAGVFHRAHPDWVLPTVPEAEAIVEARGVTEREWWRFPMPRMAVRVDLHTNGSTRVIELAPHLLALLPEESRCYLVFRGWIEVPPPDGEPRSARLRLEEGWDGGRP